MLAGRKSPPGRAKNGTSSDATPLRKIRTWNDPLGDGEPTSCAVMFGTLVPVYVVTSVTNPTNRAVWST